MSKKTTSKKKKVTQQRKAISWLKLPEVPVQLARVLIFILVLANAGLAYVAYSNAASYTVRFIYFCASNSCSTSRTASTVESYGSSVQSWYRGKTGKSMSRSVTVKIVGSHTASYYYTHGSHGLASGTTYNTSRTYYNVYDELVARGWLNGYTKDVVVLGFRSMDNCGVGGGNLAISDPQKGCASIQPSVLAHELGHTWLTSSNSDHTTNSDYNVMHAPLACNGKTIGYCTLYSSQKTKMLDTNTGAGDYSGYWFY